MKSVDVLLDQQIKQVYYRHGECSVGAASKTPGKVSDGHPIKRYVHASLSGIILSTGRSVTDHQSDRNSVFRGFRQHQYNNR